MTYKLKLRTSLTIVCLLLNSFLATSLWSQDISDKIDKKDFDPATLMWYKAPADIWEDALPVGNGRLGAMVFGGVEEERIQLNEDTYYSGGPYRSVVKGGHEKLAEIQQLLFEGEPIKAHKLFGRHLMGYPIEQQKYQCLGNLHLFYAEEQESSNYKRWLDLTTGIAGLSYVIDGVIFTREVLSSHVDQAIAIRLTASEPGKLSFESELRGSRNTQHSNYGTDYFHMDGDKENELVLTGRSADYLGIESKMRYEARARFEIEGGEISRDDARITVSNANSVTIYIAAATNFVNYKDVSGDEKLRVQNYFLNLDNTKFSTVRDKAVQDYQGFFSRVSLDMECTAASYLPTDERMESIQSLPDPQMAALSYQFGRYLMISSSRVGTQPANLQGIWNAYENPSWDSKYTTNINIQMNYWAVESGNLSELSEPLFTMIDELTDEGSEAAKEIYGADGWVFHQNTDLWRVTTPMDGPTWGTFTVGGAWLTTHMWEHYLYTRDKEFLKKVYPILKGSVDFFMDFLIEHPNGEWLVTSPSNSPENPPEGPGYEYFFDEILAHDYFTTITYGSTIDMQILKDLFKYYIEATEVLDMDKEYAATVAESRARLAPSQVGKSGMLQEWSDDFGQLEPNHRHFSHLYGLYPGNVLSTKRTPELVEPIKAVLEQRGDGATGWSRAWKMSLWSRLYDGDRANSIYKGYLKEQCTKSLFAYCGTTLQVDGAFGVTAAVTEMIIQSHEGLIHILPALPNEWSKGHFDGVCVRGGFELDMKWEDKKLTSLEILSKAGETCKILSEGKFTVMEGKTKIKTKKNKDGSIQFETTEGKTYRIINN